MENRDNLIYFQDWLHDNTLINGHIDKETQEGEASVFIKIHTTSFDLIKSNNKKELCALDKFIIKYALETLTRHKLNDLSSSGFWFNNEELEEN